VIPGTNRAVVIPANKKNLRTWEGVIRTAAADAVTDTTTGEMAMFADGPLGVILEFRLERPKSRKLEVYPVVTPDADKLARAVLDGLQKTAFADDKQVARLLVEKRYAFAHEAPGVRVTIHELPNAHGEAWSQAVKTLVDAETAPNAFSDGF